MAEKKNPYAEIEQRAGARGFGPTAEVVMPRTKASTAQSNVSTATGQQKLPFVAKEAEGRSRQAQAAGDIAAYKAEEVRLKQKQAAEKEVELAKKVVATTERVLKNPTLEGIIGRRINPIYGMFGHNDPASESPEAGWPRLMWGGSQASNLVSDVDFLQKQAAMTGRAALRPDPQIGQQEQKMAGASQVNLNWDQSPQAFAANARRFADERIRLANKYILNQEAERRRSLKEGRLRPSTFKEGDVAKDANGVTAVFKKGKWVEVP